MHEMIPLPLRKSIKAHSSSEQLMKAPWTVAERTCFYEWNSPLGTQFLSWSGVKHLVAGKPFRTPCKTMISTWGLQRHLVYAGCYCFLSPTKHMIVMKSHPRQFLSCILCIPNTIHFMYELISLSTVVGVTCVRSESVVSWMLQEAVELWQCWRWKCWCWFFVTGVEPALWTALIDIARWQWLTARV